MLVITSLITCRNCNTLFLVTRVLIPFKSTTKFWVECKVKNTPTQDNPTLERAGLHIYLATVKDGKSSMYVNCIVLLLFSLWIYCHNVWV